MTRRQSATVLLAALCALVSGCASYREGELLPVKSWPPMPGQGGRSVGIVFRADVMLNGEEQGASLKQFTRWQEEVVRAYVESDLFSDVRAGSLEIDPESGVFVDREAGIGGTDLRVEITLTDRMTVNWTWSIITGLTVYIIPSRAADEFVLYTIVRNDQGDILAEFEESETVYLWQHLFLIPAMAFSYPSSVERETVYDLNRSAIVKACSNGVF